MARTDVVLPGSIDTDGGRDESGPLTEWVASLGDGWRWTLRPGDVIRLDNPLAIVDQDGWEIVGEPGAKFTRLQGTTGTGGAQLAITGGDGWVIHGVEVEGGNGAFAASAGTSREAQHCVWVSGATNFCVYDVDLHHSHGDAFYWDARKIGPAGRRESYFWCDGGWLYRSKLHHAGRQLCTLQGAQHCVVSDCDLWEGKRAAWEMEPRADAFNGVYDVWLVGNRVGYSRLLLLANAGSGPCDEVHYERNLHARSLAIYGRDAGISEKGIAPGRRRGWTVVGNGYLTAATARPGGVPPLPTRPHFGAPSGSVMQFERYDDLVIAGNECDVDAGRTPSMVMAGLKDCDRFTVSGNRVVEVVGSGSKAGQYVRPGVEYRADLASSPL